MTFPVEAMQREENRIEFLITEVDFRANMINDEL